MDRNIVFPTIKGKFYIGSASSLKMRIFKKTTVKVFKCLMSLKLTKKKCSNFKKITGKMRNFYCI